MPKMRLRIRQARNKCYWLQKLVSANIVWFIESHQVVGTTEFILHGLMQIKISHVETTAPEGQLTRNIYCQIQIENLCDFNMF